MQADDEKILGIEDALHRIERKYAPDTLFNEVCGLTVLCLWARYTGTPVGIADLEVFLSRCNLPKSCLDSIVSAIGAHWNEYYELVGSVSEDDAVDLFETRYVKRIQSKVNYSARLDTLSLALLDIKPGESCLDLCSGAGFFVNMAWMQYGHAMNVKAFEIVGVEFDKDVARYAGLIALIRGAHGKVHTADCFDTKLFSRAKFDKVHCDAPFGLNVRELNFNNVRQSLTEAFPDFPPITLVSSEWFFAAQAVSALKDGGRAVVIMPRAALSSAQSASYRRYFVARGMIESVVAFPEGVYPGTAISIAIVTFKKGSYSAKLFDVAGSNQYDVAGQSFNGQRIIKDLANLANYGDIVTRSTEQILGRDGELDPAVYLAEPSQSERQRQLGELVQEIQRGIVMPKGALDSLLLPPDDSPGICYLTPKNITDGVIEDEVAKLSTIPDGCGSFVAKMGDLVISRSGVPFKCAVVDEPNKTYLVDGNLFVCRPSGVDPYYLKGYFEDAEGTKWLKRLSSGLQQTLSAKKLLLLPVPAVESDKASEIASAVRERLEKIKRLKRELKKNLMEIKSQFIQTISGGGISDGN